MSTKFQPLSPAPRAFPGTQLSKRTLVLIAAPHVFPSNQGGCSHDGVQNSRFCTLKTGTPTGRTKCKPQPPNDFHNEQSNSPRTTPNKMNKMNKSQTPLSTRPQSPAPNNLASSVETWRLRRFPDVFNPPTWRLRETPRVFHPPSSHQLAAPNSLPRAPCSKGGVTMNVIFGTWNRVSRKYSKNPQLRFAARGGELN
jgi:hypothetical protein